MTAVVEALGTLGAIALCGWLLGRFGVLGQGAQPMLARVTFAVAIPSLLVSTIGRTDLHVLFSRGAVVAIASDTAVLVIAAVALRSVWRLDPGRTLVGTLSAGYVNAGHLGIPIALYVSGDALAALPTFLFQVFVISPAALTVFERLQLTDEASTSPAGGADTLVTSTSRSVGSAALLRKIARNPVIVAALAGLTVTTIPGEVPDWLLEPFRIVGAAAAPLALLSFGMSLATPRAHEARLFSRELMLVVVLRALVHPVIGWVIGWAIGLEGQDLLLAVTMASLPTAQNVLVYALQYGRDADLARDSALVTSILTVPVMLLAALFLT